MNIATATKATAKATKAEALSIITKALEQAHDIIKAETGAPKATILVTRALKGRHAHFTPYTPWRSGDEVYNEIAFNAESFSRGANAVLGSLLHEVAHSMNHANGIEDCTSNQYHNRQFRTQAEALGLTTQQMKGKGYAVTELSELGAKRWSKALRIVENALNITALGVEGGKKKTRNTNLTKAECACGNSIRASKSVLDLGVRCDGCEGLFTPVEVEA